MKVNIYYLSLSCLLIISVSTTLSYSVPVSEDAPHDIFRRTTPQPNALILGHRPDIPTTSTETESELQMSDEVTLITGVEGSGFSDKGKSFEFGSGMLYEEGGSRLVISFPDSSTNCSIAHALIHFRGRCHFLLNEEPCGKGYWLILNKEGHPECALRPCPPEELFYRKKCVNVTDSSVCGPSEILYIDYTGNVYCDCQLDYIYDSEIHRCLAEHSRGSCEFGYHLEFDSNNKVQCVFNPCKRDDLVQDPKTRVCYNKDYTGACSQKEGFGILFIEDERTAVCYSAINRRIFEVPTLSSCPPGSKKSYLGSCEAVLRFSGPFSYTVPSQHTSSYSVCPPKYTKYPDGSYSFRGQYGQSSSEQLLSCVIPQSCVVTSEKQKINI